MITFAKEETYGSTYAVYFSIENELVFNVITQAQQYSLETHSKFKEEHQLIVCYYKETLVFNDLTLHNNLVQINSESQIFLINFELKFTDKDLNNSIFN